jgi:hypothetical protein
MNEEQAVQETAQPEEENKTKKYLRTALLFIFLAGLALVVVMAALRKYGA